MAARPLLLYVYSYLYVRTNVPYESDYIYS